MRATLSSWLNCCLNQGNFPLVAGNPLTVRLWTSVSLCRRVSLDRVLVDGQFVAMCSTQVQDKYFGFGIQTENGKKQYRRVPLLSFTSTGFSSERLHFLCGICFLPCYLFGPRCVPLSTHVFQVEKNINKSKTHLR